jgi:hypothetical protein
MINSHKSLLRKAEKMRPGSSKSRWEAKIEMDNTAATADDD